MQRRERERWRGGLNQKAEIGAQRRRNQRKCALLKKMTPLWTIRERAALNEMKTDRLISLSPIVSPPSLLSHLTVKATLATWGTKEVQLPHPDTNLSVSVSMAAFPLLLQSKLFDWRAKGDSGFDWPIQTLAGEGDSRRMPRSVLHHHPSPSPPPAAPPQVGVGVRSCDYCDCTR